MIRILHQWAARRRLAQHRKANIARIHSGPSRYRLGRFIRKENHA